MDGRTVSPEHMKAGADYLEALRTLGLNPSFLGWGWDNANDRWLLVLVTSIVDAGGALALNQLLFKAYNANATPKEISPFVVRIFSPEIIPANLGLHAEKSLRIGTVNGEGRGDVSDHSGQHTLLGIELDLANSYQNLPIKRLDDQERLRAWERFRFAVERAAA